MGNLLKETPYSEITATMEVFASHGVERKNLNQIRSNGAFAKELAEIIRLGFVEKTVFIPSPKVQIERWKKSNKKYNLCIPELFFEHIRKAPKLTDHDKKDRFVGVGLFYGFGNNGNGECDPLESGERSWEIARKVYEENSQFDEVKFKEKWMRLRPEAPRRPQGFFWKKVHLGQNYQGECTEDAREMFPKTDTGMAFEGIQLLAVIVPEYFEQMNGKDNPFIKLADYDIAPLGNSDFSDSPTLFVGYNRDLRLGGGGASLHHDEFGSGVLR